MFKIWKVLWDFVASKKNVYVETKIHGFPAVVPVGHWYLLVLQNYPKFNSPLVNLLFSLEKERKRKLTIVDVGSAVGDTVLLLESVSSFKHSFVCIDGDEEYNSIISHNLNFLGNRFGLINSLVSDVSGQIGKIVKDNPTTGSSISNQLGGADSLDNLLKGVENIDLVKIDIDGFDGKAISGLVGILEKCSPAIIFEWNTPLFLKTGNDVNLPFKVLESSGYKKFFWFDNFGNFLFVQNNIDFGVIAEMSLYSQTKFKSSGLHFDIVAFKSENDYISFIS